MFLWKIIFFSTFSLGFTQNISLISKTRSPFLIKYRTYSDATILHFKVPEDVSFVSFKFVADELDMSLLGCSAKNITLYLKYGAPPVIHPDGSKFPESFLNVGRPIMHYLEFEADKTVKYVNMSTPYPGDYFAAVFRSYTDPKTEGITQDGLTPECFLFVDAALYSMKPKVLDIVTANKNFTINLASQTEQVYKLFIPEAVDHVLLSVKDITFCPLCSKLIVRVQANNIPTQNSSLITFEITREEPITIFSERFWSEENCWHYISFYFEALNGAPDKGSLTFSAKFFSSAMFSPKALKPLLKAKPEGFESIRKAKLKAYRNDDFLIGSPYRQYDLLRENNRDSFSYSFDIELKKDDAPPTPVNLSSKDFTVLKFKLNDAIDSGGTLQFIMAFKPKVSKQGSMRVIEKEPENHTVVGCISNTEKHIPIWPNKCFNNDKELESPLILNKTVTNASILIPYPESGTWFISLKLFCGKCEPCNCTEKCKEEFRNCVTKCELECINIDKCNNCIPDCEESILNFVECAGCDCDGPCRKTDTSCNSSIVFDLTSSPCAGGNCGKNGKCIFTISEGFAYSSCMCLNNYRGWDCSDDSQANSFGMVVLELLLLVLSNLAFLPAVYIAYKRGYLVESIVYFSTCFFSTFYHACDAGENIISFCIVRLSVLQFSDFYSALLSIWVTLMAMAYVDDQWKHVFHVLGAILLAFGTTYNKTSLWAFLLPALVGILILAISWYLKYRQTKQRFPSKRYLYVILPLGLLIVGIGLICYSLLQTKNNYKYLHSVWHMLMAVGIIILLPNKQTFLPKNLI